MALLLRSFNGKVDWIYIDPTFDMGADFSMSVAMLQAALRYGDNLQDEERTDAT